jgi:hypothetical protein
MSAHALVIVAAVALVGCASHAAVPESPDDRPVSNTASPETANPEPPATSRPTECRLYAKTIQWYSKCATADMDRVEDFRRDLAQIDEEIARAEELYQAGVIDSAERTDAHAKARVRCTDGHDRVTRRSENGC